LEFPQLKDLKKKCWFLNERLVGLISSKQNKFHHMIYQSYKIAERAIQKKINSFSKKRINNMNYEFEIIKTLQNGAENLTDGK